MCKSFWITEVCSVKRDDIGDINILFYLYDCQFFLPGIVFYYLYLPFEAILGSYCNHYFLRMLASIGKGHYDAAFDTGMNKLPP